MRGRETRLSYLMLTINFQTYLANTGGGLQMRRKLVHMWNTKSQTADRDWNPDLGLREES